MKKIPTLFLLALTGGAAYYFLKGKKEALENLIIKPIDIAIDTKKTKEFFWSKIFYNIKFKITNPSGFKVMINSVDIELLINNRLIASIQKNTAIAIAPNVTEVITLTTAISSGNIIQLIRDIIMNSDNIKFAIQGNLKTDLGTINVAYSKDV